MKVENFSAAVEFYSKAIAINPHNAVYYCNRSVHRPISIKLTETTVTKVTKKKKLSSVVDPRSKHQGLTGGVWFHMKLSEHNSSRLRLFFFFFLTVLHTLSVLVCAGLQPTVSWGTMLEPCRTVSGPSASTQTTAKPMAGWGKTLVCPHTHVSLRHWETWRPPVRDPLGSEWYCVFVPA